MQSAALDRATEVCTSRCGRNSKPSARGDDFSVWFHSFLNIVIADGFVRNRCLIHPLTDALLQTSRSHKAISLHRQPSRGADREGNTVGDLAPDTFDEEYRGAQEENKGTVSDGSLLSFLSSYRRSIGGVAGLWTTAAILGQADGTQQRSPPLELIRFLTRSNCAGIVGLLEVIASDYKRTQDTVSADEKAAADAHADFEKKSKDDIAGKEGEVDTNEGKKSDAEDDLADAEDSLSTMTSFFPCDESLYTLALSVL